ncbi:MAG: Trk system potassium transporter TrkA [Chthoniobacterales bacterium]|nr:Trk system potassium transporter TrkA [Chthoniobacterales bacterium]
MNIIIVGAGSIGLHMARTLSEQEHSICLVENDEKLAAELNEQLDSRVIHGSGASVEILEEAGVAKCDVLFALTSHDHTNLVCTSIGKSLGARRSIARTSLAMQREQWLYDYAGQFRVDYLFSPARLAAVELAKSIRNPDCLAVEELARGRIELQQIRLEPGSPALAIPLRDLGLPPRVRIGAVLRRGKLIIPQAGDALEAGDLVTIFGHPRRLAEGVRKLNLSNGDDGQLNVVIFGGGDYGFALAQALEGGNFRTRIMEKDRRLCEQLGQQLQKCTVINADATSLRELKEERVGDADFFVAATHDDEDNVMACLQARDIGAKACLTLIHRSDYASAIRRSGSQLGILDAVSPRVAVSRELARFVTADEATVLRSLPGGVEILSVPVGEGSAAAGRSIAETNWPPASGIIALQHGNQAAVPAAEDRVEIGDTVVAIVSPPAKQELLKLLGCAGS